jgi:hypothetical protein
MTPLTLAISDFALPAEGGEAPRLDALGRLLARGRREPCRQQDWRHWVLGASGLKPPEQLPVASTLAGRPGCWMVATPVHLLAGLEHLHLDPAGLPVLSGQNWQELSSDFNHVFADSGYRLEFDGEVALLDLGEALEAVTHDPQPLAGRDAAAWMPSGPGGGRLRRLMTEIQMWLHDHPVNAARSRRGVAPVNCLWLWGGGGETLWPQTQLPGLASNDPFLRKLWQTAGAPCAVPPSSLAAWLAMPRPIVSLELASIDPDPGIALQRLEQAWFRPLEEALAEGTISRARLHLGAVVATLHRHDRWRFWRPQRDWHEALR